MSELNNEDIPMTYHIFEVIYTETQVFHQGVHIPSHIKGKEAIEAYMKTARQTPSDKGYVGQNPYGNLWEGIIKSDNSLKSLNTSEHIWVMMNPDAQ